ncbi:MAG: hydroxymethylglutaryl-CoA reductase, degradative [Paracoccaceae bacterium]
MTQNTPYTARLSGLRHQSPETRLARVTEAAGLASQNAAPLAGQGTLPVETADGMIENVVGLFELPLGVAANFLVNDKEYLVPMAVEEPSVVAAASFMARIVRDNGGFTATSTDPIMRAQVQLLGVADVEAARTEVLARKAEIVDLANTRDAVLTGLGGGCRDIEVHVFEQSRIGPMVVVHLLVDVRDAMGANTVNTMAEAVAPLLAEIAGGEARLRILSNLADRRLVKATTRIAADTLTTDSFSGDRVAQGIVEACVLAEIDPYRAATHNKGIMNGIDPVVLATGNDWRAIEAGAHAWAARSGQYTALTRWDRDADGALIGEIELPMAVGIVGGATRTHPAAQAALNLMRIETATELGGVIASVGLAQNMAALRALATEGIQRGHMALHARNIAIAAGAEGPEIDRIAKAMAAEGEVTMDQAKALLGVT